MAGYRPPRRVFRLRFEDGHHDGLVVRMRTTSVGRALDLMRFLVLDTDGLTPEDVAGFEGLFEGFAEVLVEWNVEDDDGRPVPATLEGVRTQPIDFVMGILNVWFGATTTVSATDPLAATSPAGEPSAVPSLPMVPLSPSPARS